THSASLYFYETSSYVDLPQKMWRSGYGGRYLLRRMSPTEYPNLVVTSDFRRFDPVTHLRPEERYNWLRSELIRWRTFAGRMDEGILYRPEDFDPARRYPIIFYYYERMSDGLHNYLMPGFCEGKMNIPWFVSRGYLVFCPDIYYIRGDPGAGIYDCVVSAAKMMGERPWV